MRIVIIDYGMGNIKSIISALKFIGVDEIILSNKVEDIINADKLILPGVGSFAKAMENIKNLKLDEILKNIVIKEKKPILGICLGMQLMTKSSDEDGLNDGMGFISADVRKFATNNLKVPHVGFNQVTIPSQTKLYHGLDNLSDFYFTHSYQVQTNSVINQGTCEYGNTFVVSYEEDNIAGVQFHPELSQTNGLKLLKNFVEKF